MKRKRSREALCRYCLKRLRVKGQFCDICAGKFVEGQYRRLRFAGMARITCANCGQEKRVGTAWVSRRDNKVRICEACYKSLVQDEREKRRRISENRRNVMLAEYWRQKESHQQARRQPGLLASEEEQKVITSQFPSVNTMLTFFAHAGVPTRLLSGAYVQLGESTPMRLADAFPPHMRSWNEAIDNIALKSAAKKFIKAIERNANFGPGFRAYLKPDETGFVIMHGSKRVAFIRATGAQATGAEVIDANFLVPGPPWRQLASTISSAHAATATEQMQEQPKASSLQQGATRHVGIRRFDELPGTLDPVVTDACLAASRRIRTERQVAYDRPVILQSEVGGLRLLPITSTGIRLLLPFRIKHGLKSLSGKLELILGDPDPLPLLIDSDVHDEEAVAVWARALLGFADATCSEMEWALRSQPRQRPGSSPGARQQSPQSNRVAETA